MKAWLTVLFLLLAAPAFAIGVDETPLDDPAKEELARELMKDLRCLVCQNQSIEDSDADMAADLRTVIREQVAAGKSEAEIRTFMVDRYGDWILMQPPFNIKTLALWIAPLVMVLIGMGIVVAMVRRRKAEVDEETPLSEADRVLLNQLQDGDR